MILKNTFLNFDLENNGNVLSGPNVHLSRLNGLFIYLILTGDAKFKNREMGVYCCKIKKKIRKIVKNQGTVIFPFFLQNLHWQLKLFQTHLQS